MTVVPPFKMLVSFHYFRRRNMAEWVTAMFGDRPRLLFADSGAYSAKHQGVPVTLDDYCAWLKAWGHLFDVYPALDVIGSGEATWQNHRRMEDQGLRPIPVFHGGEPWRFLDRYIEGGHKYIALGGMVGSGQAATLRWIVQCFKLAEPAGVRFHGFGQTNDALIRPLPWFSVDSTSWSAGARYGLSHVWDHRTRNLVIMRSSPRMTGRTAFKKAPQMNHVVLRAHGIDPVLLNDPARWHHTYGTWPGAVAWRRFEGYLADRHNVEPPEGREKWPHGTNLFLATTSTSMIAVATAAYDWEPTPRWQAKDLVGQPFRAAPDLRPKSRVSV